MSKKESYILALDQGTTSSRAIVFSKRGEIVSAVNKEFTQYYPHPAWVEHDPLEILSSQLYAIENALSEAGIGLDAITSIGITNQRETTIIWDRKTLKPVYNAIVWQCRRTAPIVEELKKAGHEKTIQEKTGLVLDAYFSGTKIKWILDNVPGVRSRAEAGELCFGTADSWLIANLTKGASHQTDYTNASRTLIYNIKERRWDEELLKILGIPKSLLPEVKPSSSFFGDAHFHGKSIPITGVAGDQQAALFGQACFQFGDVKNTYGTGCFILVNTDDKLVFSKNGLLTTMACSVDDTPKYALEGSIFVAGAVIQWLRDELRIIDRASDTEYFATRVANSGGAYLVPAFVGLGTPYWDSYARGTLIGLTRGTNKNHIIRAALEAIAYQTKDIVEVIKSDLRADIKDLKVDGGASHNNFLMQFQADLLGKEITRPKVAETTALGAAYLSGLASGFWSSLDEIKQYWAVDKKYSPNAIDPSLYAGWQKAVSRSRDWASDK